MRVLLDTHAFVWWIADSERLSRAARSLIADATNEVLVSAASGWEIATKYRLGELPEADTLATDLSGHIARQGFGELAIGVADAERGAGSTGHLTGG